MTDFEDCVVSRTEKTRATLIAKAEEYATSSNRFHNFDVAARILDCTPEKALEGMLLKHIVSILDLIEWSNSDKLKITEEIVDEKVGDTINYLILLEGLFRRRINSRGGVK